MCNHGSQSRGIVVFLLTVFFSVGLESTGFSATPTGTPCTCSGSKYVVLDMNKNGVPEPPPENPADWPPGYDQGDPQAWGYDAYWTMEQNGNQAYVKGHGIFPNPWVWEEDYYTYDKSTGTNTITLTEQNDHAPQEALVITASKINDCQTFNKVDFFWKIGMVPYATATMVDSNGDGKYDSAVGTSNMHLIPPILFDEPIQFYTNPTTGRNYWVIPSVTVRIQSTSVSWGPRTGGINVFVPVGSDDLEFKCGDDVWGRVTLDCGAGPIIPTLSEWGSIVFVLAILFAGILLMRKTGFGKKTYTG
jgi:hypothetical protein